MPIALSIFGIAFAALCIWLTVRIVNRRERWAKWTLATAVGLPLLYVASFGPACWWFSSPKPEFAVTYPFAPNAYWPFGWLAQNGPQPLQAVIVWYANQNGQVVLPIDSTGHKWASWTP